MGKRFGKWQYHIALEIETESTSDVQSDIESKLENYGVESSEDRSHGGYEGKWMDLSLIKQNNKVVKYDVSNNKPRLLLGMIFVTTNDVKVLISIV